MSVTFRLYFLKYECVHYMSLSFTIHSMCLATIYSKSLSLPLSFPIDQGGTSICFSRYGSMCGFPGNTVHKKNMALYIRQAVTRLTRMECGYWAQICIWLMYHFGHWERDAAALLNNENSDPAHILNLKKFIY